jgi:hypothetical protein
MTKAKQSKKKAKGACCPYCDEELIMSKAPFCKPCGVTLRYCAKCQTAVPREATACPKCGSKLERE